MEIKIDGKKLELIRGDITKQTTEAIVNAANNRLAPGGGVAGAIHRAAGPELWEECKKLGGCETGKAKISRGYNLPAKWVIHTVGPIYSGSIKDVEQLASCYRESIKLADRNSIQSISFPAISTGIFGYPVKDAAEIALKTAINEMKKSSTIKLVRFVLYDSHSLNIHESVLKSIISENSSDL